MKTKTKQLIDQSRRTREYFMPGRSGTFGQSARDDLARALRATRQRYTTIR